MRSSATNSLVLAGFLTFLALSAQAQSPQVLSPYSAYGLGDISPGMFAKQRASGGVSLGIGDRFQLTPGLASSYAMLERPTFAASMRTQLVQEETAEGSFNRSVARFMGLAIGMPINNGSWGLGFGLTPQTDVGYEFSSFAPLNEGGQVEFEYTGSGGLNKMFGGLSKRLFQVQDSLDDALWKKAYFGASFNYLFGSIGNTRRAIYPRNQGYYNTNSTANVIIRDPSGDLSFQYEWGFKTTRVDKKQKERVSKWVGTVGAFYGIPAKLGARRTDLTTTYFLTSLGIEVTQDTVEFIDRAKGNITTPAILGVGGGLTWNDRLSVALEYRTQDWSDLKVNVEGWELPSELATRSSLALGVSYCPEGFGREVSKGVWERTVYSMGLRQESDYLVINGSQLEGYAASAGISLPVAQRKTYKSRFTIGTEVGSRGSTENGGIKESYVEFFAGFSITPRLRDKWFQKRKIE